MSLLETLLAAAQTEVLQIYVRPFGQLSAVVLFVWCVDAIHLTLRPEYFVSRLMRQRRLRGLIRWGSEPQRCTRTRRRTPGGVSFTRPRGPDSASHQTTRDRVVPSRLR